jgi:hypothetical protein
MPHTLKHDTYILRLENLQTIHEATKQFVPCPTAAIEAGTQTITPLTSIGSTQTYVRTDELECQTDAVDINDDPAVIELHQQLHALWVENVAINMEVKDLKSQ